MTSRKNSTKARILKNPNLSTAALALELGTSKSYVYSVRNKAKRVAKRVAVPKSFESNKAKPAPEPKPVAVPKGVGWLDITPTQFICANKMGYLEGRLVSRIWAWSNSRDITHLHEARVALGTLIDYARVG